MCVVPSFAEILGTGGVTEMATAVAASVYSDFMEQLSGARKRMLLLDYDGTLAPFTLDRGCALPYPEVPALLESIMTRCNTRVCLITGRQATELSKLIPIHPRPEIWGSHGLERLRPDGSHDLCLVPEEALKVLSEAAAWLEYEGLSRTADVKYGAVAVHWRGLPLEQAQEARTCAYRVLAALAGIAGLSLCEFDGGVELRARRGSKGDAVQMLVAEVNDDVPVAYLGDDLTDEYAFRALAGRGLTVLVRSTYRFTAAQTWLRPPEDLVRFLKDWTRACGGEA